MISIIIPCYNAEKTIKRCLESVISQTYKNIEIVIINDGSTDKTDSIIKKYINDANNVTIITHIAAKNFPNTTPTILTGDVNINCSVPVFLSSANILIVNIGAIIIKPYNAV